MQQTEHHQTVQVWDKAIQNVVFFLVLFQAFQRMGAGGSPSADSFESSGSLGADFGAALGLESRVLFHKGGFLAAARPNGPRKLLS